MCPRPWHRGPEPVLPPRQEAGSVRCPEGSSLRPLTPRCPCLARGGGGGVGGATKLLFSFVTDQGHSDGPEITNTPSTSAEGPASPGHRPGPVLTPALPCPGPAQVPSSRREGGAPAWPQGTAAGDLLSSRRRAVPMPVRPPCHGSGLPRFPLPSLHPIGGAAEVPEAGVGRRAGGGGSRDQSLQTD